MQSETVARATRSRAYWSHDRERIFSFQAQLQSTAVAQSFRAFSPPSAQGFTIVGKAGRSATVWWSKTKTSTPRSFKPASSSESFVPQSTTTRVLHPPRTTCSRTGGCNP